MLLIYNKETGEIKGINTSPVATFDNMFPNVAEDFKQKYGGIITDFNDDYDKNRKWYKVENEKVIKLESPFIEEDTRHKKIDLKEKKIAELKNTVSNLEKSLTESQKATSDLEMAIAAILGGAI